MTKKQATERKANWSKALAESRVARYNFGMTLRSYPTADEARAECERFKEAGHMTPAQYKEAIAHLGLSKAGAGRFLTGRERTSRSWASGESPVPRPVALLLRLMVKLELKPEDVTDS